MCFTSPLLSSLLTPIVAMKNPALCESHPNICDDRHGTEETIISCQDGMRERKNKGMEEERESNKRMHAKNEK